jgi:uncharacterized iron-regulated membrane protein
MEWQIIKIFEEHPYASHRTSVENLHKVTQVDVAATLEFFEWDSTNDGELFCNLYWLLLLRNTLEHNLLFLSQSTWHEQKVSVSKWCDHESRVCAKVLVAH